MDIVLDCIFLIGGILTFRNLYTHHINRAYKVDTWYAVNSYMMLINLPIMVCVINRTLYYTLLDNKIIALPWGIIMFCCFIVHIITFFNLKITTLENGETNVCSPVVMFLPLDKNEYKEISGGIYSKLYDIYCCNVLFILLYLKILSIR